MIGRKIVGFFQKDVFEAKKMELLIKVFNKNVDLIKQRGFNAQTSAAIEKYCACKGLVPSKYWELKLKKKFNYGTKRFLI